MTRSSLPFWFKAGVPVILVALTVFSGWLTGVGAGSSAKLKEGVTYAVWIAEAEVSPKNPTGSTWDTDSSAPDLSAMIAWQNQIVLRTVVVQDAIIACWEPVAVDIGSVLRGEISTSSVQRVARVRLEKGQPLVIGVFDEDLLDREFAGGVSIAPENLRLGSNEITSPGTLRRMQIMVADNLDQISPIKGEAPYHVAASSEWLSNPPPVMVSTGSILATQAQEAAQAAAHALSVEAESSLRDAGKILEESSKAIQEQGGAAKKWLQKNLPGNP